MTWLQKAKVTLAMLAIGLSGCTTSYRSSNSRSSEASASSKKPQLIEYFKKLKVAADQDAFFEPKRMETLLGMKTEGWRGEATSAAREQRPSKIFLDVPVIDEAIANELVRRDYIIFHYDNEPRYSFNLSEIDDIACITAQESLAIFGAAPVARVGGVQPHGNAISWQMRVEYRQLLNPRQTGPLADTKQIGLWFAFNTDFVPTCLKSISIRRGLEFIDRLHLHK
jgi:hypothetical protein